MTDYVVTVKQVLVPLTDGQSVMLPRGYQVPADALAATVTHLLALGAIEAGEGASIGGIAPDLDGEGNPIGSAPSPTPPPYVRTVNGDGPDVAGNVEAGGGDTSGLLSIADPAGVTSPDVDNPVTGSGTMKVVSFPADTVALALKRDTDDFPFLLVLSAGADDNIFYAGDGTADPYNNGASFGYRPADGCFSADSQTSVGFAVKGNQTFPIDGTGPIVMDSTDGHTYRLGSTDGALTLTLVT